MLIQTAMGLGVSEKRHQAVAMVAPGAFRPGDLVQVPIDVGHGDVLHPLLEEYRHKSIDPVVEVLVVLAPRIALLFLR